MDVSDLEPTSNSDEEPGTTSNRSKVAGRKDPSGRRSRQRDYDEDFDPGSEEVKYGTWNKNECLKVKTGLMTFGYELFFCFYFFYASLNFLEFCETTVMINMLIRSELQALSE